VCAAAAAAAAAAAGGAIAHARARSRARLVLGSFCAMVQVFSTSTAYLLAARFYP
jgi:hypothetical protein